MDGLKKVRFATFFPNTFLSGTSVHLYKDVGMIPYILHREYGYESSLITYRPTDKGLLDDIPQGLGLLPLPRGPGYWAMRLIRRSLKYDSAPYMMAEALCIALDSLATMLIRGKDIDVFQLYHFKPESMLMALIYRLVNRKGIVYMKLDMDPSIIKIYQDNPQKKDTVGLKLSEYLFKRLSIDFFSVESRRVYEFLRDDHPLFRKFRDRVIYIPNGVDMKQISAPLAVPKERIVLHAGRSCNPQKRTNVILEAFSRVSDEFPDWKLALVGPMDEHYIGRFEDFMRSHADIRERILNVGFLKTREEVYKWYERSKILAIPSRFESFGLVVVEAQLFGDSVIGSDIPAIRELTADGELGYLCPVDDIDCFARTLRYMMSHEDELAGKAGRVSDFAKGFDWNAICGVLRDRLTGELARKKGP